MLEGLIEERHSTNSSVNVPKVASDQVEDDCICVVQMKKLKASMKPPDIQKLLQQKEEELTQEFQKRLEKEISTLKERAEFILQNEQIRASYLLREAHRERQEKITALQTQLECKNLAGLMYVMCTERNKSKLEKLRLIEEYTGYITALKEILTEAQDLILNLSKGYKTAARVDEEWRHKMKAILTEFQMFVHDYTKGTPESDQYLFDWPALLKTESPLDDDPMENPCDDEKCVLHEKESSTIIQEKKPWYERLDEDTRPFIMFGDMAEFKPPQRREVLRAVKGAKTAPSKWKEYVFNDMFVKSECNNVDAIKDVYPNRIPTPGRWECHLQQDFEQSRTSYNSRRTTTASVDIRGNMGSILKMITTSSTKPQTKALLLGARDSMEIASTTRLREKHKHVEPNKVMIHLGAKRASIFDQDEYFEQGEDEKLGSKPRCSKDSRDTDDDYDESLSVLGSIHNDSMTVIPGHVPDKDHKIHYEKICPMEECKRLQMDSFMKSLPPYMRANPYTHFEQTFDGYQVCSPEQIAVLKKRIEAKKIHEKVDFSKPEESPLEEWSGSTTGVGVQTSDMLLLSTSLPPCTCIAPQPTPADSTGCVFDMESLVLIKKKIDDIKKEYLYDDTIEFNRFKVIGQDSIDNMKKQAQKKDRVNEITSILKHHPSFLDIFQGNTA